MCTTKFGSPRIYFRVLFQNGKCGLGSGLCRNRGPGVLERSRGVCGACDSLALPLLPALLWHPDCDHGAQDDGVSGELQCGLPDTPEAESRRCLCACGCWSGGGHGVARHQAALCTPSPSAPTPAPVRTSVCSLHPRAMGSVLRCWPGSCLYTPCGHWEESFWQVWGSKDVTPRPGLPGR